MASTTINNHKTKQITKNQAKNDSERYLVQEVDEA